MYHCIKSALIWSYSGTYFRTFGLNTERYGVSPSEPVGQSSSLIGHALREKYPNKEFFLVRVLLYSDQKKHRIWTLFTQTIAN